MQPIRATHRILRTQEGEAAWRTQALDPPVRALLGSLRNAQTVSELLRPGLWSPYDLENTLNKLARSGWVLIQEQDAPVEEGDVVNPIELSSSTDEADLEALLSRHRSEEEAAQINEEGELPDNLAIVPVASSVAELAPVRREPSPPEAVPAKTLPPVREIENVDELPFDPNRAEDDGLLNALRNPEKSASNYEQAPDWAPPSGGLAALLRALGESVPEGVDLSPDQQEHLRDLAPLEPWGGASTPKVIEEDKPEKTPFARLRDQPAAEGRQKARLGALHQSLGKVQQEQAQADAARDRARQVRADREAQLKKVHAEQALRRQQEERGREGSTLIGLSQKLARVKNNRDNNE